jgi:hypothetical protein
MTRVAAPGQLVSEEYVAKKYGPEALLVRVDAKKR